MSDRPTISSHPSGGRYSVATLNANFQALRDEFDNVVGTNGVAGDNNSMSNNLDMNGNNVINAGSILDGSGVDLALQAGYAEEWASKAEDSLVSVAAGGNLVDEYSSLHHSAKSDASATASASSATSAASSATTAAAQATTATTQASAASTSATNAATSATNATSIISSIGLNYNFDTSTTMADPGTGDFRLNNGTVASVTAISLDATTNDTGNPDLSDFVATWDDSTNTIAGYIVGKKVGTPATFFVFSVSAVADNTGWLQLTVSHVASSGTWSSGNDCIFQFSRSGDKGTGDMSDLTDDLTPQLGGFLDANSRFISHAQGAAIASVAGDTNIWTNFDGNTVHITGTNAITDFGTPKSAGDSMWVIFDAAASVVDSATITVAGNTNYQAAANDLALVYALTTSTFLFMPFPNSGLSPVYDTDTVKTDVANTFTKAQSGSITALADGTNISVNLALNNHFSVTLAGNRTLDNPTNIVAGTSGSFFITQDGSGSRTLAYGSYYDFAAGAAPTLTTTAAKIDRIDYVARTTTSLHCVFTGDLS
jgi:hypothetical protein